MFGNRALMYLAVDTNAGWLPTCSYVWGEATHKRGGTSWTFYHE